MNFLLTGDDYQSVDVQLTFGPSTTQQNVEINTTRDILVEDDEVFSAMLSLDAPIPNLSLNPSIATITILDDDCK